MKNLIYYFFFAHSLSMYSFYPTECLSRGYCYDYGIQGSMYAGARSRWTKSIINILAQMVGALSQV